MRNCRLCWTAVSGNSSKLHSLRLETPHSPWRLFSDEGNSGQHFWGAGLPIQLIQQGEGYALSPPGQTLTTTLRFSWILLLHSAVLCRTKRLLLTDFKFLRDLRGNEGSRSVGGRSMPGSDRTYTSDSQSRATYVGRGPQKSTQMPQKPIAESLWTHKFSDCLRRDI